MIALVALVGVLVLLSGAATLAATAGRLERLADERRCPIHDDPAECAAAWRAREWGHR
ncbi:MAG: hypothetical protein M0Z33_02080 [Actinomycetota bacterium]|nr:hypothetical protein [Actinomycetota bacterium]